MRFRVSWLRFKSAYFYGKLLDDSNYWCVFGNLEKKVKKCYIPDCRSNYAPSRKNKVIEKSYVKVFRFPRDASELELWMKMMPYRNLALSKNSVICVKHWPEEYDTMRWKWNKERPTEPPSVLPGVPPSCVPTPKNPPRPTNRTSLSVRDAQPDQMEELIKLDRVTFPIVVKGVVEEKREFCCPTISYVSGNLLYIQSDKFSDGVPRFLVEVEESMKFSAFHMGIKIIIPSLSKNEICVFKTWSAVEEKVS